MSKRNNKTKKLQGVMSPGQLVRHNFMKNKLAIVGAIIFSLIILVVIFAPLITPADGNTAYMNNSFHFLSPSESRQLYNDDKAKIVAEKDNEQYSDSDQTDSAKTGETEKIKGSFFGGFLGSDQLGYDMWTRILYGGRNTLVVAIIACIVSTLIGTLVGGFAGYYGGKIDMLLMRFTEIVMTFPYLPTLLVISFAVQQHQLIKRDDQIYLIGFIIGVLGWGSLTRMIRGQILSLREQEFMEAATALGISDRAKVFKHLLPNTLGYIIVSMMLSFSSAILAEVSLSFLGLGVSFTEPSWGNIMQNARNSSYLTNYPWIWIPCAVVIILSVVSINLLGEGLRDAFDPKSNR